MRQPFIKFGSDAISKFFWVGKFQVELLNRGDMWMYNEFIVQNTYPYPYLRIWRFKFWWA